MTPRPGFNHSKDGFYSYHLKNGKKRWGYEKEYKGERRKKEGFKLKELAHADRQAWINRIDARYGDSSGLTVAQLAEEWLSETEHRAKPSTVDAYRRDLEQHILPLIGPLPLSELRPAHIQEAQRKIASGTYRRGKEGEKRKRENRTANKIMAPLRAMLGYGTVLGYIPYNPAASVKRLPEHPKERRFLTAEEAGRLLDAVEGMDYALIATALGSGMRRGEVMGLKWEDLDLERSTATVRRTIDNTGRIGTPKDHQVRTITTPEWLRLTLIDWWRQEGSPQKGWVFHTKTGNHLEGGNMYRRIFQPALERAGLEGMTFHGLRHSFATLMLDAGAVPLTISHLLGHADPETTHRFYAHYIKDHEKLKRDVDAWFPEPPRNPHDKGNRQEKDGKG